MILDDNAAYTKHNLYVYESAKPWSIQALLWPPKSQTEIHSHKCWCTFGVYQGQVVEQLFNKKGYLISEKSYVKYDYGFLIPNQNDIHRIINPNQEIAISIHLYGINGFCDNSVAKTFQEQTQHAKVI